MYYEKQGDGKVQCFLCPHRCVLSPDQTGVCRARKNMDGRLYSLNYDKISAIAMDSIEKKPLYKFYSGSSILSVGTFGCNLKCSYCQNHEIAHGNPRLYTITSKQLVEQALSHKNNLGIAYTYNEPGIWYEYVRETSRLARARRLKNVMVTNGYICREPLEELLKHMDAANIDLKSFQEDFYRKVCKGTLCHVKESIEAYCQRCHVEITFLAVPDLNDGLDEMDRLARWLASLDKKIPLHILRFRPCYQMAGHRGQTYEKVLELQEIALKHLWYVYAH
ncbi:MAG: AmmeMemoRadiSam system radical SAM enzyme [Clostridia bacterium]